MQLVLHSIESKKVHGLLATLPIRTTHKQYILPASIAIQKSLKSVVVVENRETAMIVIDQFRKKQKGHPAKQVFQAIRIEVNNELEELKSALVQALDLLNKNATLSVITFHSLEDRIVKQIFNEKTKQISTPKNLVDLNQKEIEFVLVNKKPILASQEEIENNNRAHSAKLRGIRRI